MRNMSFAHTAEQIATGTKTVTRRLGWRFLKEGDCVRPVRKSRGLKKGEKVQALRGPLRVVSVRRESLRRMIDDVSYGFSETAKEGFGLHPLLRYPSAFIDFFCATHRGCAPESEVTRIEFEYE